jgi:hypothetical protein
MWHKCMCIKERKRERVISSIILTPKIIETGLMNDGERKKIFTRLLTNYKKKIIANVSIYYNSLHTKHMYQCSNHQCRNPN